MDYYQSAIRNKVTCPSIGLGVKPHTESFRKFNGSFDNGPTYETIPVDLDIGKHNRLPYIAPFANVHPRREDATS